MKRKSYLLFIAVIIAIAAVFFYGKYDIPERNIALSELEESFDYRKLPKYSGSSAYTEVNGNIPFFDEAELTEKAYEYYGPLDGLGRCTLARACLGKELMPTSPRESISSVKPSGWKSVQYDFIDGKSLYNRSHLIGFQLSGENANSCNLITGTRYMNAVGMLPFENMVADYINETENHVAYRITPIFIKDELIARGVLMEAYSVEDGGEGICYNVFCYNVQPGIEIDYSDGSSKEAKSDSSEEKIYILNTGSKKFHSPNCQNSKNIKDKNKQEYRGSRDILVMQGYTPCSECNP